MATKTDFEFLIDGSGVSKFCPQGQEILRLARLGHMIESLPDGYGIINEDGSWVCGEILVDEDCVDGDIHTNLQSALEAAEFYK